MTTETHLKSCFDDWQDINQCEQCEHWWNNTCDGSKSSCNAFKPTRRTEIPQEIESLKTTIKHLVVGNIIQAVALMIHLIGELL